MAPLTAAAVFAKGWTQATSLQPYLTNCRIFIELLLFINNVYFVKLNYSSQTFKDLI
jgi:hypothetical protein